MKKSPLFLSFMVFALGLVVACGSSSSDQVVIEEEASTAVEPSLTFLWETAADLITNESVHFEPSNGKIYVANIEGGPAEKDGVGSISIISRDGEIVEREWVKGLHAPKGMTVMDGKLYVTDVDVLVEIDLATGEILKRYGVESAQFLNDADTDGKRVYFSEMRAGRILYLENGTISTFAENQPTINGLRVGPEGVLYGLDAEGLKKYRPDGTFDLLNDAVTGGDGLIILDQNTFLATRWKGEIYLIRNGMETLLLDTSAEESNTADIGFIPGDNIVLVPTFFNNKVVAYRLDY
jgi:DNA-binding beta-propeller fold protein YncE